jgi:hypothetical protein
MTTEREAILASLEELNEVSPGMKSYIVDRCIDLLGADPEAEEGNAKEAYVLGTAMQKMLPGMEMMAEAELLTMSPEQKEQAEKMAAELGQTIFGEDFELPPGLFKKD